MEWRSVQAPILSTVNDGVSGSLLPVSIVVERSALQSMRVINQVDSKFILTKSGSVLYVHDTSSVV